MDDFFHSLSGAFAHNQRSLPDAEAVILGIIALALTVWLVIIWTRRHAQSHDVHQVASQRGLSAADLRLVSSLARRIEAKPMAMLTQLDVFERATAGREDDAGEIRRLRGALGFDRLPSYAPLLSSRELAPGTAVSVGAYLGQICASDERAFAVEAPNTVPVVVGQSVELTLTHAREVRYALHCSLLEVEPMPDRPSQQLLRFAHDEAPVRIQRREYARVPVNTSIALRPCATIVSSPGLSPGWVGTLVDVSGGGALIVTTAPLPVGMLALASFTIRDQRFEALRAVVLSCQSAPEGCFESHLEFSRIPPSERERLIAVVMQVERARVADWKQTARPIKSHS